MKRHQDHIRARWLAEESLDLQVVTPTSRASDGQAEDSDTAEPEADV